MKSKKIMIIAVLCIAVGAGLFIAGFAELGFDFGRLGTEPDYEEKSYTSSSVRGLIVDEDNAPITITTSDDDSAHVTYSENERHYYEISETGDGTLLIEKRNSMKWYDYIGVSFGRPALVIALPRDFSGDIEIDNGNGGISLDIPGAANVALRTSNGDVTVKNAVLSGDLKADTNNGSVVLEALLASGRIECETNNGGVSMTNVNADSADASTDNGKISLDTVTAVKSIRLRNSNKDIVIDKVKFGTSLSCQCDNGSIIGTIVGTEADFTYDCRTSNGECNLPESFGVGSKQITIETSNGDIDVSFSDRG